MQGYTNLTHSVCNIQEKVIISRWPGWKEQSSSFLQVLAVEEGCETRTPSYGRLTPATPEDRERRVSPTGVTLRSTFRPEMYQWWTIVVAACWLEAVLVAGYSTGAPPEVCQDLTPKHPAEPQKTRSPYIIRLSKVKIHAGESSDITISGNKGETFKGFILQARVGQTPVGKFSSSNSNVKLIDCGTGTQNSATHANSQDKKEVTITWTAPPSLKETVIFYATVAQTGEKFWVAQKSRTLAVA